MIRRSALAFAILGLAACERQPTGPALSHDEPALRAHAADGGPPPPRSFGPDSRETGVNTGEGVPTGLSCVSSADNRRHCNGFLASAVDGTRLDVTLDVPAGDAAFPLVVLLHGWAGSKTGSSDIAGMLLDDGYAVLRYSARGFGNSYGLVNLADVGVEIGDLRSMIAQVAEVDQIVAQPGFSIKADAVAVTGASYGGGQSWLAALQPVFQRTPTSPAVRIRAIIPIVPWSDLLFSLVPNGQPRRSVDPPGALKLSYVDALYSSGCRNPPVCDNYPTYLKTWHASLNTFEPTVNPFYPRARDGLAGYRSIWWQRDFWTTAAANRVPVFQVQGFTDDLFTLEEARRMLLALKAVDPLYPITSYFGDLGHPRARTKAGEVDYVLKLIRAWLAPYMKNDDATDDPSPKIYAAITRPAALPFDSLDVIALDTYDQLATAHVTQPFGGSAVLVNPGSGAGGAPSDPLLQAGIGSAGELKPYLGPEPVYAPDPTAASYDMPVVGSAMLIAAQPTVTLRASTLAPRVQFNVRLYDVAGLTGPMQLVTRGTYTVDSGSLTPLGTVNITIRTQGNLWCVPAGHVLRLEVTNVDAPYIAPSQIPSTTEISNVQLEIPVRPPDRC